MVNRCVFYRINREKGECGVSLYTLHSTLYTLHSPLYTLHSTLYILHSTLYILHSTFYTLPIYLIIILLAKFRIGSLFNRNKVPSY